MGLNINSGTGSSLLQQLQERQNTTFERLASGRRVNSASDDAAAQQIIERLTSQGSGNRQAIFNSLDGVSLAQVADSGLAGINDGISRIRELSLQAGNGLLTDGDRRALQNEVAQIQQGIRDSISNTEFAGTPLLSSDGEINFQVGANAGQNIGVATTDVANGINDLLNVDISTAQGAQSAIDVADTATDFVGSARSSLGATQNALEANVRNLSQADVNLSAARSRLQDTDFAQATAEQASNNILSQAATSVQVQANQQQSQVLALLG